MPISWWIFAPGSPTDHYLDLKDSFEHILGRDVDMIDRIALQASRNFLRRRHMLAEAEPIYVA